MQVVLAGVHALCMHAHACRGHKLASGILLNLITFGEVGRTGYLIEPGAHQLGQANWPVSSRDHPLSFHPSLSQELDHVLIKTTCLASP